MSNQFKGKRIQRTPLKLTNNQFVLWLHKPKFKNFKLSQDHYIQRNVDFHLH